MSFHLLDAARDLVNDDLVLHASQTLGESGANIRRALKGSVPAVLAGILHQFSLEQESQIADLLSDIQSHDSLSVMIEFFDSRLHAHVSEPEAVLASRAKIRGWQWMVFGAKYINIINAVSIYGEIRTSSANALLALSVPLAVIPLSKYGRENGLDIAGIHRLLMEGKEEILKEIPAGFNLAGSLGINQPEDIGKKIIAADPEPSRYLQPRSKKVIGKWIWPIFLLLTFGGLLWYFYQKERNNSIRLPETTETTSPTLRRADSFHVTSQMGAYDSSSGNFVYDAGLDTVFLLPDSTVFRAGVNSAEAILYKLLKNTSNIIDSLNFDINRIILDQVFFEDESQEIDPASQGQLRNLAAVMKNYPTSEFRLEIFTDAARDSVFTDHLTRDRAKILVEEFKENGITDQLNEVQGLGSRKPLCHDNTPECRARNRRVELTVRRRLPH